MKKMFLLLVVLAALTVFCSAAFSQYSYPVPTLETVRRDGSTVNVYTYRDWYGNKIREIEYYVNDDGSYGNLDVYFGSRGLAGFIVKTDYQNGVCTVFEQSISYSAGDLTTVNARKTTVNPDGRVNVLTYTTQELEKDKTVTTGMETDGMGRKLGDFREERYKDADNNNMIRHTVYNPDKTVNITHRTENRDGTEIRMEWTFDENDRALRSSYTEFDAKGEKVYSESADYTYTGDGQVVSENLIADYLKGTQLHFIEKMDESGSMSTAEGELLDKNGNKLADYSFEKTWGEDDSEIRVDTYRYPDGRVDIISKKVDADGKITVNEMPDFKAAGEETEESAEAGSALDSFSKWYQDERDEDIEAPDDELIRYFGEINDVWSEKFDGDIEDLTEIFSDLPDDLLEDFNNDPETDADDSGGEPDEIADDPAEDNNNYESVGSGDRNDDDDASEDWGENDAASGDRNDDDDASEDWGENDAASEDRNGDDGASEDWAGDDGASEDWAGDDGGSEDWDCDDGASEDWAGDDGASEDGNQE